MSQTAMILPALEGLLHLLESDDFYAEVAVSSSIQSFYRRLSNHALTNQLKDLLRTNPESTEDLLQYAERLARSITGTVRHENDVALCASVVALAQVANPRVDDFFRFLKMSKHLALRWASETATISSRAGTGMSRTETALFGLGHSQIVSCESGSTIHPRTAPTTNAGLTRVREVVA